METTWPGTACEGLRPEPANPGTRADDGGLAVLVQDIADVLRQRGYHVRKPITCTVEDGFLPQVVVKVDAITYLNISCRSPFLSCTWHASKLVAGRHDGVEVLRLFCGELTAENIVEASLTALDLPWRPSGRA
ncbi:hypothetical protein [Streptomyces sp. MNP-20]|uniref:hypothetical protein n=1 Tax=Streptomyces sp. MNP-20 TaxID=2721165 RepID=UPI001551AB75|nr:hypothetical protein [Streptomyces sp. MNP-20]